MKFTIPISPKAQKRARSRAVQSGGQTFSMTYTDKDQRTEQNRLMALMYEHRPPEPLQGPLLLGVKAYLPIPKSKPKKWQAAALAGDIRPISRPDTDNLIKQIKDCANRAMWGDDCQVVEYLPGTGKYYDDGGGTRWEIEIVTLEEYRATLGNGDITLTIDSGPQVAQAGRLF